MFSRILIVICTLFFAACDNCKEVRPITKTDGLIMTIYDSYVHMNSVCIDGKLDNAGFKSDSKIYIGINVPRWFGQPVIEINRTRLKVYKSKYLDLNHHQYFACYYETKYPAEIQVYAKKETEITLEEISMRDMLKGYLRITLNDVEPFESGTSLVPNCMQIAEQGYTPFFTR